MAFADSVNSTIDPVVFELNEIRRWYKGAQYPRQLVL